MSPRSTRLRSVSGSWTSKRAPRGLLDGSGLVERGHGRLATTTPRLRTNNTDDVRKAIAPATLRGAASTTTPTMSAISPACIFAPYVGIKRVPSAAELLGERLKEVLALHLGRRTPPWWRRGRAQYLRRPVPAGAGFAGDLVGELGRSAGL